MQKLLLLRFSKLLMLVALLFGVNSYGQGSENFTNLPDGTNPSSYQSKSWTGTNGVTWTATNARADLSLTGKAIGLQGGSVSSPQYSGGIGTLQFQYVRAFTGAGARGIKVFVNGTQRGSDIIVNSSSDEVVTYNNALNISGNVTIEIRTTGTQIKIDNISWTGATPSGPSVTTASAVPTTTGATINGTINANSATVATAASFDYGAGTTYGSVAAATPASVTGNTATAISATLSGLTVNTRYTFRAVGTTATATINGDGVSFYTLANTPGAPVISAATASSLSVTLNTATQNGNPAATEYAIQVGSQYVQLATGALGAAASWASSASWGTKVVSGLTESTTYTFAVKARNGSAVETAFGTTAQGTTLLDTNPRLSATTLTAFGPVCLNTTSAERTFTLSGSYLTGPVTVGPFNGYTFSASANGDYTQSLALTPSNGNLNSTVHVKFMPVAATSYNGRIPVSGGSATAISVAVSGSGINTTGTVTTAAVTQVTFNTATLGGNVTAEGCSAVTRGVVYGTTASPALNGSGTVQITANGTGIGAYTVAATNLMPGATYYVRAYATNNGGTVYGSQVTFTTPCASVTLPFSENFDAAAFPPACWSQFMGTNGFGIQYEWTRSTTDTYNGSAGVAFVGFDSMPDGVITEDWLVTPGLVLPDNGSPIKLKFQEKQSYREVYGTNYYIKVSTTSQTSHAAFTNLISYDENAFGVTYSERIVDLSAYAGQTIYIAFVMTQNDGDSWYVDNVTVKEEVAPPVAIAATDILPHSFTANWTNVVNATGYLLDVSTTINFTDTVISENFSGFTTANVNRSAVLDAYLQQPGWTGTNVYDSQGSVRIGAGSTPGNITTPTLSLSVNDNNVALSFQLSPYLNDSATTVQVLHAADGINFTPVGSEIAVPASVANYTLPITQVTASSKIRIQTGNGSTKRFYIDDILITKSGILPEYNNLPVAGTSVSVTSLAQNTNYYYRVRATGAASVSPNSNKIALTTGKELIWNGTQWTDNVLPRDVDSGTIEGEYNTFTYGNFTIGALTIAPTGSLNIAPGTTVKVENTITNNAVTGSDANTGFTIENNGALLQGNGVITNTNTGNVVAIKNGNPLYRLDYTLWASPVDGQTLGDFSPQTSTSRFYEYGFNTAVNREQYLTVAASTVFAPAKGYLIRMPNSNLSIPNYNDGTAPYSFTGRFTGKPHNGNYSIAAATNEGYTAVGNPYPSPIGVTEFFAENIGVMNASSGIYFWRKRNNAAASSYATLTLAAYTSNSGYTPNTDDSTNDVPYESGGQDQAVYFMGNEENWRISQGQGFFVRTAPNPTGTSLVFKNSMRKASVGDQAFFRTGNRTSNRSRIWLNLTDAQHSRSQAAIAYMDNATNGLDYGYDGAMLNDGGNVALYSVAENTMLAIQARPSFNDSDVVALGYKAALAGQYSIAIDHADGVFSEGQQVFLRDNFLGTTTNLESGYSFTTEEGTFNNRFEIIYATTALNNDAPELNTDSVIVYKDGGTLNITSGTSEINRITIYDIRGRVIYEKDNVNAKQLSVAGLQVAQEVIIVRINTQNGIVNKKAMY